MKKAYAMAALSLLVSLVCSSAHAWDVLYDASTGLLPTEASPAWQAVPVANSAAVSDGLLHMPYPGVTSYSREGWAINPGVPVTMEARMYVVGASSGAPQLSIQTKGVWAYLEIFADHISAYDTSNGWLTFAGDFTRLHTIRIAYDGGNRAYAWVDTQSAFSWGPFLGAGQNGLSFGASSTGSYDSYWQYVAYGKEFLPVPEPSSLLGIGGSLLGLLGLAIKRRGVRG